MAVIDQRASSYAQLDQKYRVSKFVFMGGFLPTAFGLFGLLGSSPTGTDFLLLLIGAGLIGGGISWGRSILGQMRYVITYPADPMAHLIAWGGSIAVVVVCALIGKALETGMTAVVSAGLLAVPPWFRKRRTAFMLDYAGITAAGTAVAWDQVSILVITDTAPDHVSLGLRLRSGGWSDGVNVERHKFDLNRIVEGARTLAPGHVSIVVTDREGERPVYP
ncbi:hypothetical protein HUT18_15450 [Streptomyces sp. NA04227]|uniref:hypothetical protein n=1 Tax=Streptomyces sp. NA04227 TaxID=2742136 RepID=UPI00159164A4|nr:hypothetical protein [Streptomyces sp. NA04227]QKW07566.1 hypothetical protein HUT18_15450 [Streptomyces sp. NA04227]